MSSKHVAESRKGYWRRTLRPLYWWLLLVLVLYGIRLHQQMMEKTRIQFTVWLQNAEADNAVAYLDGAPVTSGTKISLGHHKFTVRHPKAESFSNDFFAWYGPHDLGKIELKRSMGSLSLHANPPAETVTVSGPEYSGIFHDLTSTNLTVPADTYSILAGYPHWSQNRTILVSANQTASCFFEPNMGAAQITCNKGATTYHLEIPNSNEVISGSLPATLSDLPIGQYLLTVYYHNQQIQKSVLVKKDATNNVSLQFLLGAAHIETDPPGATVRNADGAYLGETPLDIPDLKPQTKDFTLALAGYESMPITLEITADQTNSCRTNLVNLRYRSSMEDVKAFFKAGNYQGVVEAAGQALKAKPDDAEALQFQTKASKILKADQEKQERLKRPKQAFDALCKTRSYSSLFEEHELKTSKPAKDVANAIESVLRDAPSAFDVFPQVSIQPETESILAQQKSALGILDLYERHCVIVVGQAKDDETQIWFKVLEYQIKHTIQVNGLLNASDNKQLIPLHYSQMQMSDLQNERVRAGVRLVQAKIEQALNR